MAEFPGLCLLFLWRQEADLEMFQEDEDLAPDPHTNYDGVSGIGLGVTEKLAVILPATIVGSSA